MSVDPERGYETVAELRDAFDRSFAAAPSPEPAAVDELLQVGVAGMSYVMRLSEIAGLYSDLVITRVPTMISELLGVVHLRGVMLPVYDLGAELGHPASRAPRWLTVAGRAPLGLAFDGFEGHLRVRRETIVRQQGERPAHATGEVIAVGGRLRPIISVPSVLSAITARVQGVAPSKER